MPQTPASEAPRTGMAGRSQVIGGETIEAAPAQVRRDSPPRGKLSTTALATATPTFRGYPIITVKGSHPGRTGTPVARPEDNPNRRARRSHIRRRGNRTRTGRRGRSRRRGSVSRRATTAQEDVLERRELLQGGTGRRGDVSPPLALGAPSRGTGGGEEETLRRRRGRGLGGRRALSRQRRAAGGARGREGAGRWRGSGSDGSHFALH